jgi:DNA-directed RNA polymerase specialized sigma24 family protein
MPHPSSSRSRPVCFLRCTALAVDRADGGDPPIPTEHFTCLLRDFSPLIRALIRSELGNLPLGPLARKLAEHCPGIPRPGIGAVRTSLLRDEHLADDLYQEVILVLWRAVSESRVRAARPVVYRWLQTATRFVVRRYAPRAAVLSLVAAPGDDEAAFVDIPSAPANQNVHLATGSDIRTRYSVIAAANTNATAAIPKPIRAALLPWLDGAVSADIAQELGISDLAVRLRLMRARRYLDAVVRDDDLAA